MFVNLEGFIKCNIFLGVCVEYCFVDWFFEDKFLFEEEIKWINDVLK